MSGLAPGAGSPKREEEDDYRIGTTGGDLERLMRTYGEDVALGSSSSSSFASGHHQQQQQQRPQQRLTVSPPARDSSTIFSTSAAATNTNTNNFFISPSNAFSSPGQYSQFLDLLRSMPSPTDPWTTVLPTTPQLGQGYTLPANLASPGAQGFTLPTNLPSPNAEATLHQLPHLEYNDDSALPPFPWFTSGMEEPNEQQQQQEGQPGGSSSSLLSMDNLHDILEQVGNMTSDNRNHHPELFHSQSDFSPSPSPPTSTFDGSNMGRSPSPSRLNSAMSTRPCTPTSSMSSESCCSDNAGEDDQVVVSGRQRTKRKTPDRALNEAEEIQSAPEKKP